MKFVTELLSAHLTRYPEMQIADVYKLLHQAALGPGHALKNPAAARNRLEEEAAQLHQGFSEPEQDVISPDGRLGRVHLRTYMDGGGDLDALHQAFVDTANNYPASTDKLAKFCSCLGDSAVTSRLPFAPEEVLDYFDKIARAGFPAVHHSERYHEAYHPAYRVIALDLLQR